MTRLVVGPFNRVEGDLEVTLDIADHRVTGARVSATLYRGFETMLAGKAPGDALVIAPRICGICSLSHSAAAARAIGAAAGIRPPPNGERAINLMCAAETVADLVSHFYLFFAPDLAKPVYADQPWFATVAERFTAIDGAAGRRFLPARARFLQLMGLLAGKWPHSLVIQPGGSTRAVQPGERPRLLAILREFRRYLEDHLLGDGLERIAALSSRAGLDAWAAEKAPESSDFRLFLHVARALGLERLGRGDGPFLSSGGHAVDGRALFTPGLWDGAPAPLDLGAITEDSSHAWYDAPPLGAPPMGATTLPRADQPNGYSWSKAPRLAGRPAEVGALARQRVDGQPLIADLVAHGGANVLSRMVARMIELVRLVPAMERWVGELEGDAPYCLPAELPDRAQGIGAAEAARGLLGHWLSIKDGRIASYQVIAPTTWNFSPRDAKGIPGPLERALIDAPVRPGETSPIAVQHIVRSFDPCLACTVH